MEYFLVGIGGIFGSIARFALGKLLEKRAAVFPFGTFAVNISGAFLLGIVTGTGVDRSIYLLCAEGFLGAYTTFSTFMYEGFRFFERKAVLNALVYILGSLLTGLAGFTAGYYAAGLI